jgi:hypothetical protein
VGVRLVTPRFAPASKRNWRGCVLSSAWRIEV